MSAHGLAEQREAPGGSVRSWGVDLPALGVFILALCARLLHIWAISGSPFFTQLLVDSVDFDARAMAFVQGSWLEEGAFYQAPLYPLFLSFVYRVFGHSLLAVRLVQALLGSVTALLVYLAGRRCCGRVVGLVAGLIAALYSMAIHFDAEILRPSLVIFLAVLCLHLLLSASSRGSFPRFAAGGFTLGLASIARPTLLAFVPLAALWVYTTRWGRGEPSGRGEPCDRRAPGRRRAKSRGAAAAVFLCCALVPVGAVTWVNYARSGQFVLISYNGGINFFIGNNPEYERAVGIRPGIRWDILTSEPPVDRRADPAGWSRYYYDQAFAYMLSDPAGYARLTFKKFALFWNRHEIERNVDFSHVAAYSPFMSHKLVSFGWVAPLAIVGMVLAWRRRAPMGLLALYLISQMAGVLAFFVCARYRMIAMPPLWIFAAYAAVVLVQEIRRRSPGVFLYLGLGAAAAAGINFDAYNISKVRYADADYELALIMRREGRVEECLALLARSETERPDDPDPPFQRGATLAGSGRFAEAALAFEEAARREPGYSRTWFNLGLCLARVGENMRAADAYKRALELEPGYWEAWMALAGELEAAGRPREAADAYRRAEEVARDRRGAAASRIGLARIEASGGRLGVSLKHLDAAIDMDPSLLDARLARARVLKRMGLVEEAELEAQRAAQLFPSDPRVDSLLEELRR